MDLSLKDLDAQRGFFKKRTIKIIFVHKNMYIKYISEINRVGRIKLPYSNGKDQTSGVGGKRVGNLRSKFTSLCGFAYHVSLHVDRLIY